MGNLLIIAVGAVALYFLASGDEAKKPAADCYAGLSSQQKAAATWFLEAPLGAEAPEWIEAIAGPEFAEQLTISSKVVAFMAGQAEKEHPQLAACLFKRAAVLAEEERQKGGA